ncbi:MAG: sigma-70 family RNA polymerase sigma factor [Myxococcota bacterium]
MGRSTPRIVREDDEALRAKLGRVVARACPPWAAAHREDIVQAAMLRVVRARERNEDGRELPSSYLWKVAYSATIDEVRRLRAKREVSLGSGASDEGGEPVDAAALGPERRAESAQLSGAIAQGLGQLNEARRQAVTLYLQGHSVPEIGRLLGWPPKRAENMVYRGLAKLREHLAAKGWAP